jgi:hypothetical protein
VFWLIAIKRDLAEQISTLRMLVPGGAHDSEQANKQTK